jgi:hypothetical protein
MVNISWAYNLKYQGDNLAIYWISVSQPHLQHCLWPTYGTSLSTCIFLSIKERVCYKPTGRWITVQLHSLVHIPGGWQDYTEFLAPALAHSAASLRICESRCGGGALASNTQVLRVSITSRQSAVSLMRGPCTLASVWPAWRSATSRLGRHPDLGVGM